MATLPADATRLTISNFDLALRPEAETCDLSSLRFIDAYGLIGTANAIRIATSNGEQISVRAPKRIAMKEHLAAMGLDEFLNETGLPELGGAAMTVETSGVVVPLRSASDSGGEQAVSQVLWEQLRD
jgi:hypothetical protein